MEVGADEVANRIGGEAHGTARGGPREVLQIGARAQDHAPVPCSQGLEQARRNAALQARQQYLGATNGLPQVRALKAALISSQSSLESNRLGFEVGVRINIDVLNADNQVYVTRRDLAKAVLETLMSQLRLKAAVGTLSEDDVVAANALLDPAATQ